MEIMKSMNLDELIEMNREEAGALMRSMISDLPEQMSAVAGMMAAVDVLTHLIFSSISEIVERRKTEGLEPAATKVAEEAILIVQQLLNLRVSNELIRRDLVDCDCPKCRARKAESETKTADKAGLTHIRLH